MAAAMDAVEFSKDNLSKMIKNWDKGGKSEFLAVCPKLNEEELFIHLSELGMSGLAGGIPMDSLLSTYRKICSESVEKTMILAEVYGVLDVQSTCNDDAQRKNFLVLAKETMDFIPSVLMMERVEQDTWEALNIVDSKMQFGNKYVKTKTKLYYKQKKFNLLREEMEGYGKIITELAQSVQEDDLQALMDRIKGLIGCFHLDPNRVLDLILEVFECRLDQPSIYVPLLQHYAQNAPDIANVLGFKFKYHAKDGGQPETPKSLYQLAALMIQLNVITLDMLYSHLSPSDSVITEFHMKNVEKIKLECKKNSITSENKVRDDFLTDIYHHNQKVLLVVYLLEIGAWAPARQLMEALPPYFCAACPLVSAALCRLAHHSVDNFYIIIKSLPEACIPRRNKWTIGDLRDKFSPVKCYTDLPNSTFAILRSLGSYLSSDILLLTKILRVSKSFITTADLKGEENREVLFSLMTVTDEVLLPSITCISNNCSLAEEMWSFLRNLPYTTRYRLYGQWKNVTSKSNIILLQEQAKVQEKARYIMKRLAKENVKLLGRQIGKISHSHPAVLFEYILSQIQRFDNFILPVVDSLKYLNTLAYDVLAFCIIEALASPERERLKLDDTNISVWLQSLAAFSAYVFKKYPIDISGLLQYILNQLKAEKSYDLIVMREILQKMVGIEISEESTSDQLAAMTGGDLLRMEGSFFAQVKNTRKSAGRLKDILIEQDLLIPFCILMAQQRHSIVYLGGKDDCRHLKLIGKLYDQCHDTFIQFVTFIMMQVSPDELKARLPPLEELLTSYHLTAESAFALSRITYSATIMSRIEDTKKRSKQSRQNDSASLSAIKQERYRAAIEEVMRPVQQNIQRVHLVDLWEDISPLVYTTFWSLSIYDLDVPHEAYAKQVNSLNQQYEAAADNKDMGTSKRKKERERIHSLIEKLRDEEKQQEQHVSRVKERLLSEKDSWFPARMVKSLFLQFCILPRCIMSAVDALYCAKFMHLLHDMKTPNFSSLICFDKIFSEVSLVLSTFTENEAHRYARFLKVMMSILMRWHADREVYDKECHHYPGFTTVFRTGTTSSTKSPDQLDYENYRHVAHKWQFIMTKAFVSCLESGSYVQIRNTLIVLTKILEFYPRIKRFAQAVLRRVEKICQTEKDSRKDLCVMAVGYLGQLQSKSGTWVHDSVFHISDDAEKKAESSKPEREQGEIAEPADELPSNIKPVVGGKVQNDVKLLKSEAKLKERAKLKEVAKDRREGVELKDRRIHSPVEVSIRHEAEREDRLVTPDEESRRKTTDISPKPHDARDTKRRKMEAAGKSREPELSPVRRAKLMAGDGDGKWGEPSATERRISVEGNRSDESGQRKVERLSKEMLREREERVREEREKLERKLESNERKFQRIEKRATLEMEPGELKKVRLDQSDFGEAARESRKLQRKANGAGDDKRVQSAERKKSPKDSKKAKSDGKVEKHKKSKK